MFTGTISTCSSRWRIWRSNDAEDRLGIFENHLVVGYLAHYDEIRRGHPGVIIDSCGGRRLAH